MPVSSSGVSSHEKILHYSVHFCTHISGVALCVSSKPRPLDGNVCIKDCSSMNGCGFNCISFSKKKKKNQPMEVFGKEHKVNFSTYVFT